jgi:regulator of sigma D
MPQKAGNTPRRRKGSRKLIDDMLTERQRVLVLMCEVMGLKPFTADKPVKDMLGEFTTVLVDYIAAGHFSLYQRIIEGTERRRAVLDTASKAYSRIATSTDAAVEFNDKYGGEWNFHLMDTLADDLSTLGETLATRIELEDRIITAMLDNHTVQDTKTAPGKRVQAK